MNELIAQLIEYARSGTMEMKEKGAMMLHSLCFQPRGLDGDQHADNDVLIAKAGAVKPLVAIIGAGSPVAQLHACGALAAIANGKEEYQKATDQARRVKAKRDRPS